MECIHGFEEGFCDICFPRASSEPPVAVKAARAASASRTRAAAAPRVKASVPPTSTLVFSAQRLYHVTHIDNLPSILADGEIRAVANPTVDVSSETTRELRETAELPIGGVVAHHVPFYLSPDAARWVELRTGAEGAHWSDAARASRATDYVLLAVPASALGQDVVLSDSDAAATTARYAFGPDAATPLLRQMHSGETGVVDLEVLGPVSVPTSAIVVIAVANDKVRDRVRDLPIGKAKVAVFPPWFAATE